MNSTKDHSMMNSSAKGKGLVFDELVARFEGPNSAKVIKETRPTETSEWRVSKHGAMSVEHEMRIIAREIVDRICRDRNQRIPATTDETADVSKLLFDTGISSRIFKNEVRNTLARLQSTHDHTAADSPSLTGSQQATLRSLKRQLEETAKENEVLKRKYQVSQHEKLCLTEELEQMRTHYDVCMKVHVPREAQARELKVENEYLRQKLFGLEIESKRDEAQKCRLTSTLGRYREGLLFARERMDSAQLEASMAKSRVDELEKQATETKESSSAVNARIKELQEVQDAISALLNDPEQSENGPHSTRDGADFSETRTRLVGRIANLLTKKKTVRNESVGSGNVDPSSDAPAVKEEAAGSTSPQSAVEGSASIVASNNLGSTDHANESSSGPKSLLDGLRKFGSDLSKTATDRKGKKTLLANVEKTRVAIENDMTLREVIAMKEREVERLSQQLSVANAKSESLERSLQQERQRRRWDNPAFAGYAENQEEGDGSLVTRNKTVFEWHSNTTQTLQSPVRVSDTLAN